MICKEKGLEDLLFCKNQDEQKIGIFFGSVYATAETKQLYQVINLFLERPNHAGVFRKNKQVVLNLNTEQAGTIVT